MSGRRQIGETAKNRGRLFDRAEARQRMLLFDAADAIVGQRAEIQEAPGRWAKPADELSPATAGSLPPTSPSWQRWGFFWRAE